MSWDTRIINALDNIRGVIEKTNNQLEGVRREMAISREQLDSDLADLVTAINNLIAAVEGLPKPGDTDFTAEDQSVQNAAQAVKDEINKIAPPPGP